MRHDWGTSGQEMGFRDRSRDEGPMRGRDMERGGYERGWSARDERGWSPRDPDGERGRQRFFRGDDEYQMTRGEAPIVKVIEVVAQSPHSWEDAARRALAEASRSLDDIKSVYVKDMQAIVSNQRIVEFRLVAKISFAVRSEQRFGRRGDPRDYA
jgi:flavin-binding protein dodecin